MPTIHDVLVARQLVTFQQGDHKFPTGRVVMTRGIRDLIDEAPVPGERFAELFGLLQRHVRGDWGDLDPEDVARNEADLIAGERLLSSYQLAGEKIYIITEHDRSYTTVLLPSEY